MRRYPVGASGALAGFNVKKMTNFSMSNHSKSEDQMGLSSHDAEDSAVVGGDDDVHDVVLVFSQSLGARRLLMKSHEVARWSGQATCASSSTQGGHEEAPAAWSTPQGWRVGGGPCLVCG